MYDYAFAVPTKALLSRLFRPNFRVYRVIVYQGGIARRSPQ